MIKLAVPKEIIDFERRVALTPDCVKPILKMGINVFIEKGAGELSSYSDKDYSSLGAKICTNSSELYRNSNLVVKINRPTIKGKINEFSKINEKSDIIALIYPDKFKKEYQMLKKKKNNVFAMELMPRISRAQSMDVLSSQSNLSGYKAVVDAASFYNKAFPLMMTSAGTIPPAKVLVIGAGVAGLQAIATAKRLGAVVFAFDVRSATKEQVESLGGNFVSVPDDDGAETSGGYAKEMTKNYKAKQAKLLEETLSKIDVVISTALIPGKPAPKIITKKMVDKMKSGSVIYDLASEFGGNCELTKHGEHVEYKSKFIVGPNNLASTVSQDASRLFSKNILNFLNNSTDNGKFNDFNWDDELVIGTCLLKNGKQNISKG